MTDDRASRISVEHPGVSERDIEPAVDEGVVILTGEKRTEREDMGDIWFFSERQ